MTPTISPATITAPLATDSQPYVDVRETHTGVVILVGERAYKAKKPVLTDFLDFRAPEQRERACRREVELNSRLSSRSYIGIAHLDDPAGGAAEPFVVMRRYHDDDRLSALVRRNKDGDVGESARGAIDSVAAVLARFHACADRGPLIDAEGTTGAIAARWDENLRELHRYAGPVFSEQSIARIGRLASEFIEGRRSLLTRRIHEECIVDGHADLLADDIFWVDHQPAILDCLEFDDRLRYVDRIDDAAFLAMDLEFLGRKDLSDHFREQYTKHSADSAPQSLWDFYIAYRAVVRAKVDCIRLSQGQAGAAADAARHLALATQHLESGAVRLAIIGGNPGTGKSTLAGALAKQFGARLFSTDDIRQELRDRGRIGGVRGVLDAGLYGAGNVKTVYEEALRRAHRCLSDGQSVILDGTWRDAANRSKAQGLATETHSTLVELVCSIAGDEAADRIRTRRPGNSDVTPEIASALASQPNDWDTALPLKTSLPQRDSLAKACNAWHRATSRPLA